MTQYQPIGREPPGKAKEDVAKPREEAFGARKAPPDFQGVSNLSRLCQSSFSVSSLSPLFPLVFLLFLLFESFFVEGFEIRLVSREHRDLSRHSNTSRRKNRVCREKNEVRKSVSRGVFVFKEITFFLSFCVPLKSATQYDRRKFVICFSRR